jgi:hypothetical protein
VTFSLLCGALFGGLRTLDLSKFSGIRRPGRLL